MDKLHRRLVNNYREMLKTPAGRMVLYNIICMAPEYPYCSEKPYDTAFNCGQHSIASVVKKLVYEADNDVYKQMRNEWNSMEQSLQNEQSED